MKEAFVSQSENDDIVKDVFIIFGYSIASIITILSLLWGYNTNTNIFNIIFYDSTLSHCQAYLVRGAVPSTLSLV